MEASTKLTSSPSLSSDSGKISEEFSWKLTLNRSDGDEIDRSPPSDDESGDDEYDFSFARVASDRSLVSAEDVIQDGQIKPVFPLFNQSLLSAPHSKGDLPGQPPVDKVFVEAKDFSPEGEETAEEQLFCAWSRKAVEASPEICKKSNSTGFSKIWRFRDLLHRSNSDGRDAFVFVKDSTATSSKVEKSEICKKSNSTGFSNSWRFRDMLHRSNSDGRDAFVFLKDSTATSSKVEKSESTSEKKSADEAKAKADVVGAKVKGAKKGKKSETASLSPHELHYVRNRVLREGDRRRTYLTYRPELVGFFTNVHGGLSRNVHPF